LIVATSSLYYKLLTTNIEIMIMSNIIYVVAIILFGFWILGFLVYSIGSFIHLLLIAAILLVLLRVIKGKEIFNK